METEEGTISSPAPLSEEIEEAKPVPLDLDTLPTLSFIDLLDPVVPAAPPGFDAKKPTVRSGKFKPSPSEPINATPISFAFGAPQKPGRGQKCKTPVSDQKPPSKKAKLMVRSLSGELGLLASSSNAETQTRAHAEAILSTFDALRRRLEQISETEDGVNKRSDLKAEMIMNANDLMANKTKRIGPVPGVEVGDIFYFRMEMCVVGLHSLPMAGIEYMKYGTNSIAIAIVASGGYQNEDDKVGEMVYTGQGGNSRKVEKRCDQKLTGGNYAMEQSSIWKNPIRVIRSRKDPFVRGNKVYIYDGLYKIQDSWTELTESGLLTFKNKLVRERGQPDGFAMWKMTENWKKEPSSRGMVLTFDLSSGVESIPVAVINEVDDDPEPDNFTYVTRILHEQTMKEKDMVPTGCTCKNMCVSGGDDCYCASFNGGWLAYSSLGLLMRRLTILYECGPGCECMVNCRNKVTQKGLKLHFEVFRTENRGWGLRSWDPIRAGSFVCEFVGKSLDKQDPNNKDLISNEYIFRTIDSGGKMFNWNQGMQLAKEEGDNTRDEKCFEHEPIPVPIPMMIDAKEIGNVSRFINHSCDPNLLWQLVRHGHGDAQPTHAMFFAMKHIPPMTELVYDYNGDADWSMSRGVGAKKCLCGAENCRGYFK